MSLELANPNQCQHISPRGQRCRMLRADGQSLCAFHLRRAESSRPDPEALAAELLDGTGNLNTADRVNALLANTVKQLARQRIDRQDALAMGYLSQLLLNTVPGVQKEYQAIRASEAKQALRKSVAESRAHLRALQPAEGIASGAGLLQQADRGIVAHAPGRQRAAIELSSRASSTGTPACAPFAEEPNLAAPPAAPTTESLPQLSDDLEPSEQVELSEEELLAIVLQATSPQRS